MKVGQPIVRRDGKWCDVIALSDNRFAWFWSAPGAVACELVNVGEMFRTSVPTDFLRFIRGGIGLDTVFCAFGQSDIDECFRVDRERAIPAGIAFGQNPVAVGFDGTPYIMRSPTMYTRAATEVAVPRTSQGIRDVLPDRTVIMGDATVQRKEIEGHPFWQYQTRDGFTVGQAGTNVGIGVLAGRDYTVIPRAGDPLGVHGALSTDGKTLAVCAWTDNGSELWLIDLLGVPDPIPAPTPQPPAPAPTPNPPTPTPEPSHMQLPTQILKIRDRFVARFPVPQRAVEFESQDQFEGRCRQWSWDLAETIVFETGDAHWGVKKSSEHNPQSKDALANWSGLLPARLVSFDMLLAVGTGNPSLVESPGGVDITGQVFIPVKPVNHLGVPDTVPAPTPTTPTPVVGGGAQLDAQLATLRQALLEQNAVIARLNQDVATLTAIVANIKPAAPSAPFDIDGVRVALKADNGRFVCADFEKSAEPALLVNRDVPQGWETFTLVRQP